MSGGRDALSECPTCGGVMNPELVMNALSRRDNKTYICSPCGTREAMDDFWWRLRG